MEQNNIPTNNESAPKIHIKKERNLFQNERKDMKKIT